MLDAFYSYQPLQKEFRQIVDLNEANRRGLAFLSCECIGTAKRDQASTLREATHESVQYEG